MQDEKNSIPATRNNAIKASEKKWDIRKCY